jgi:hypothetical protein
MVKEKRRQEADRILRHRRTVKAEQVLLTVAEQPIMHDIVKISTKYCRNIPHPRIDGRMRPRISGSSHDAFRPLSAAPAA